MNPPPSLRRYPRLLIFLVFLRLGLISFGGPVAHLGYFRNEFVLRRRWLAEEDFADLVALCQFLPGPASSQVGMAIGLSRGGPLGALAAWAGFTLPSALLLLLFAVGVGFVDAAASGWLQGLKIAAVAVVARALIGMAQQLCPDLPRRLLALLVVPFLLLVPGVSGQLVMLAAAGLWGVLFAQAAAQQPAVSAGRATHSRALAVAALLLFALLLVALPLLALSGDHRSLTLLDSFYRSGALVFGGGHVVLPLLQAEMVEPGWMSKDLFLAGYGATQAVPGPLLSFAAYLGAVMGSGSARLGGAALCLGAIFLPSFLLVIGVLPFWEQLRHNQLVRKALAGINAAVVGLLGAAFIHPVLSSTIHGAVDLVFAAGALSLCAWHKLPVWLFVGICGLLGFLLY